MPAKKKTSDFYTGRHPRWGFTPNPQA